MKAANASSELAKWEGGKLESKVSNYDNDNSIELFKYNSAKMATGFPDASPKFPLVKFFQEN